MSTFRKTLVPASLLILLLVTECIAQDNSSTTVTLPGGFTISTTSLIVGTLAVIVVAVVGVVFAARRSNSGNTTTTIFNNTSNSKFGDVTSGNSASSQHDYRRTDRPSDTYRTPSPFNVTVVNDDIIRDIRKNVDMAIDKERNRDLVR